MLTNNGTAISGLTATAVSIFDPPLVHHSFDGGGGGLGGLIKATGGSQQAFVGTWERSLVEVRLVARAPVTTEACSPTMERRRDGPLDFGQAREIHQPSPLITNLPTP